MAGLWMTGAILEAVGPAARPADPTWGSPRASSSCSSANGIIAVHPGGTADVQRVSMARRIGIGRAARESAATVPLSARGSAPEGHRHACRLQKRVTSASSRSAPDGA